MFVDLSGTAEPFADDIAPLASRSAAFEGRPLHTGGSDSGFTLEVASNWKLAGEHSGESYHLPWVHPGLNSYSRLEDHCTIVEAGFAGQGTLACRSLLAADGQRLPSFPDLPAQWDEGAEYATLYRTLRLGVHKDHLFAPRREPVGPARAREQSPCGSPMPAPWTRHTPPCASA